MTDMRIGIGYDVHKLVSGRDLILGGAKIAYEFGLLGHSDADVLVHAIMDSLLGAAAMGDIGSHFPDSDARYKGISSIVLLEKVGELLKSNGYTVGNIDSIVVAQKPKISPYIPDMVKNISDALKIDSGCVSVKATTTEELGFEGRKEGISAHAVCTLYKA